MAAGSGDTASKYVARRETPLYIPENCTQCMECIAVCPDTALPNCSQDLDTILRTAVSNYVTESPTSAQKMFRSAAGDRQAHPRADARGRRAKTTDAASRASFARSPARSTASRRRRRASSSPSSTRCRWRIRRRTRSSRRRRRRTPGAGGIFSIFVSDLCKGCAACVTACGDHQALRMVQETEEVNAEHETRHRVPQPAARHIAEVSRPLQRHASAGFQDRDAAQHADGAAQLRRAGLGRRRLRGLRREEHPQGHHVGHRSLHAAALPREGGPLPHARPTSSRKWACRSSRR